MKTLCILLFASAVGLAVSGPVDSNERAPRDPWNPFAGVGTFAGPGMAFAGAGAGAGAGFMPFGFPFSMPTDYMPSFVPFPVIPFPTFRFPMPWYKGPNVCVDTKYYKEPEEIQQLLTDPSMANMDYQHDSESCRGNNEVYICSGKKMTPEGSKMYVTKYTCCHGFVRTFDGRPGCVETDLKDLIPALRDLKATKFVKMVDVAGFTDLLHTENFTVFCPPDANLDEIDELETEEDEEMRNEIPLTKDVEMKSSKMVDASVKTITSHLSRGFLRLDDLEDEIVVETEHPDVYVRLNVYSAPYKLITANCVPITSYNNYARNGIIHTIEKKLPIATKTVADIIAGDPQFSILKRLLSRAGLVQSLRDPKGNFTIFAPSDFSFQAEPKLLESFLNGSACVDNLLKNHIVDHVICSSALANEAQTANLLGEFLLLTRHLDSKIYVDDIQVVVKDIVGTNGVVHIIDGLLVPRQAKSVVKVLEETSITQFLDLVKRAGMDTYFEEMKNVTFLVPSNIAIRKFPRYEMQRILSNNSRLEGLIMNHVIRSEVMVTDMEDGLELPTRSDNGSVRIKIFKSFPYVTKFLTIQCAKILSPDNKLCGSVLHIVDRVLVPAKRSVIEVLESKPELSMFLQLLKFTGLDNRLADANEHFTVLVPSNDVFRRLPDYFLENLRSQATNFLKMHILSGSFCCDHLAQNILSGSLQVRAVDGSLLRIFSSPNGVLRIGDARIVDCDSSANNGVVHILDSVVYSGRTPANQNIYFDPVLTSV